MENPALFVRVSLPAGHYTVPAVVAERGGWKVVDSPAVDSQGRPIPPKPRVAVPATTLRRKPRKRAAKRAAPNPRAKKAAVTPTPNPETPVSANPEETE